MSEDDDSPQADPPTPAIMQLEVLNHNDFVITDMFDGIPIVFPPYKGDPERGIDPGQVITIRPDMAFHCFGFPGETRDMALHMAKRYGWAGRDYLIPEGTQKLPRYAVLAGNIEIRPVYFDLVRRDRNEPIPADRNEPDDPREPVTEPDTGTKVGRRKKVPAARKPGRRLVASERAGSGRPSRFR